MDYEQVKVSAGNRPGTRVYRCARYTYSTEKLAPVHHAFSIPTALLNSKPDFHNCRDYVKHTNIVSSCECAFPADYLYSNGQHKPCDEPAYVCRKRDAQSRFISGMNV